MTNSPIISAAGVAAGRDVIAHTISIGLSPEQVRDLALAIIQQQSSAKTQIAELSRKLQVSEEAIIGFFEILGRQNVPIERLPETLADIARRHLDLDRKMAALQPNDPEAERCLKEVHFSIKRAKYDPADRLLTEYENRELAAAKVAEGLLDQALDSLRRRTINAAEARAQRARISMVRHDYLHAAEHFEAASNLVKKVDLARRTAYLRDMATALLLHGQLTAELSPFDRAAKAYNQVLQSPVGLTLDSQRECYVNLAQALVCLAERGGPLSLLEEAIQAFEASLEIGEQSREHWALMQNNVGRALSLRGYRTRSVADFEVACERYKAALSEPLPQMLWAIIQQNLGSALTSLGSIKNSKKELVDAIDALTAAGSYWTRKRDPLGWAILQDSLGIAFSKLASHENGRSNAARGIKCFRSALREFTVKKTPLLWARTQYNLAKTLDEFAKTKEDTGTLRQAVFAYRASLLPLTAGQSKEQTAETYFALGVVHHRLAIWTNKIADLTDALQAFEAAVRESDRVAFPKEWALYQQSVGMCCVELSTRFPSSDEYLRIGIEALTGALAVYKAEGNERSANITNVLQLLQERLDAHY